MFASDSFAGQGQDMAFDFWNWFMKLAFLGHGWLFAAVAALVPLMAAYSVLATLCDDDDGPRKAMAARIMSESLAEALRELQRRCPSLERALVASYMRSLPESLMVLE